MTLSNMDDYGHNYQLKVVAALLNSKTFVQNISDVLNDEYFSDPALKWIVNEIIRYYNKYHTVVTMDVLKVEMKKVENDVLKVAIK